MAEYERAPVDTQSNQVDLAERQKMFENFIKFWIYHAVAAIAILIFLALFNS
jgi:hypothetical protein